MEVAIVGLGNLGSRHLQGLASCTQDLRISLFDPSPSALAAARQRWFDVLGTSANHSLAEGESTHYDLAIIATTADHRLSAVNALASQANVGAWLIEKPVSQSIDDAERIRHLIGEARAWVNLPRRLMPWHQSMAREISSGMGPLRVRVSGGAWGLACNATHFVDLVRWWCDVEPESVDVSGLEAHWHRSKRAGYVDIFGTLLVRFANGTELEMESRSEGGPHLIDVEAGNRRWRIAEGQGQFLRDGALAAGQVADTILAGDSPKLPTLQEVVSFERLLLSALIPHRAADNGPTNWLDIT
jgi:predicted dehydrogenase